MGSSERDFTDALIRQGWWLPSGVAGLFGWTHAFESLIQSLDRIITGFSERDGSTSVYFPPLLNRSILSRTGYMQSFPDLCGSVHSFRGGDAEHAAFMRTVDAGRDWGPHLAQTDVALTPAVCYPLYPTLPSNMKPGGELFNLSSYVFRCEPSEDPARLQAFRMRENVRIGSADEVRDWRLMWMDRSMELLASLELPVDLAIATDPFFGRGGRMMRATQKQDEGKFEILCPICSESQPTAIASFNYHQDKFSREFGIRLTNGSNAHTACIGFGLERCALSLLKTHGLSLAEWPSTVKRRLDM